MNSCFKIYLPILLSPIAMHKSFGEQLKHERKKQGLTAEEVAISCQTSRSFITLIESGKRLPSKNLIPKIAAALDLKTVVVLNWYLEHVSCKIHKHLGIS